MAKAIKRQLRQQAQINTRSKPSSNRSSQPITPSKKSSERQMDDESDQNYWPLKEYYVEKVLKRRYNVKLKRLEYLIKWKNFTNKELTWEKSENIDQETLLQFNRREINTIIYRGKNKQAQKNVQTYKFYKGFREKLKTRLVGKECQANEYQIDKQLGKSTLIQQYQTSSLSLGQARKRIKENQSSQGKTISSSEKIMHLERQRVLEEMRKRENIKLVGVYKGQVDCCKIRFPDLINEYEEEYEQILSLEDAKKRYPEAVFDYYWGRIVEGADSHSKW